MTGSTPSPRDDHIAESPPGRPRWVKLVALVAVIALVVLVVVMLLVGGEHGPGRHGG